MFSPAAIADQFRVHVLFFLLLSKNRNATTNSTKSIITQDFPTEQRSMSMKGLFNLFSVDAVLQQVDNLTCKLKGCLRNCEIPCRFECNLINSCRCQRLKICWWNNVYQDTPKPGTTLPFSEWCLLSCVAAASQAPRKKAA